MKKRDFLSIGRGRRVLGLLLVLATLVAGTPTTAFGNDAKFWTTVGSAGTVDEDDLGIFSTSGEKIAVLVGAQLPATLNVRYNVVAVDGLILPDNTAYGNIVMRARYNDSGSHAQIVLRLKQVNLNTGAVSTLLTLDSNAFPQSTSYQTQQVSTDPCGGVVVFDFENNTYYVDAELVMTSYTAYSTFQPVLAGIQIGAETEVCPPR